jgi:hypothetical protein
VKLRLLYYNAPPLSSAEFDVKEELRIFVVHEKEGQLKTIAPPSFSALF